MSNNDHNATTHTPLEAYFLFQLLTKYGFATSTFDRISDDLQRNGFVVQQEGYHAERLSSQSLQALALRLLRDEQREEVEAIEKNGGSLSPTSRKRKLVSPTLQDAQEQQTRLPILAEKLFTRYRQAVIDEIRAEEAQYKALQLEIGEIERGEWDNKPVAQHERKSPATNGAPSSGDDRHLRLNGSASRSPAPVSVGAGQRAPEQQGKPDSPPLIDRQQAQLTPTPGAPQVRPPNEGRQGISGNRLPETSKPTNTNTKTPVLQPPQAPQAAQTSSPRPGQATPQALAPDPAQRLDNVPRGQAPPQIYTQQPQPNAAAAGGLKWEPLYQPPNPLPQSAASAPPRQPQIPQSGRPQLPPNQPQAGFATHPAQHGQPSPVPQGAMPQPTPARIAGPILSPAALAAAQARSNAARMPQSSPGLPVKPAVGTPGQQNRPYRPTSVPHPNTTGSPAPGGPAARQGQQQAPPYSVSTPSRTAPPVQAVGAPFHGAQSPLAGGQHAHSAAVAQPHRTQGMPASAPATPAPHHLQHGPAPGHGPRAVAPGPQLQRQSQGGPHFATAINAPRMQTPVSGTPLGLNTSSHVIRGHGTKWTSTPTPATPRFELSGYFDDPVPDVEPISPVLAPTRVPHEAAASPSQSTRPDARKSMQKIDTSVPRPRGRPPKNAPKPAPVPTLESGDDQEADIRKIKNEDVVTPRPLEDAGDAAAAADENAQDRLPLGAAAKAGSKRKRDETPEEHMPTGPSPYILWTRNFNRVSASALDQVIGHRHANMFAHPVKAREAPGYNEIILHPTDLRNIRLAINAGQRAATAAEKNLAVSDPSPNVWLPKADDLVPPKGIINIASLERELVHMFANAIMYANDPDRGLGPAVVKPSAEDDDEDVLGYKVDENGIVKDTRNMFVEVEGWLSDLRSGVDRTAPRPIGAPASLSRSMSVAAGEREPSAAEDEVQGDDQQAGDGDAQGTAKRRRVRG